MYSNVMNLIRYHPSPINLSLDAFSFCSRRHCASHTMIPPKNPRSLHRISGWMGNQVDHTIVSYPTV